jgi:restriction system protein
MAGLHPLANAVAAYQMRRGGVEKDYDVDVAPMSQDVRTRTHRREDGMARKRNSSVEDVIELGAALPWWAALALAAGAYAGLHLLASRPVAAPSGLGQMGDLMVAQMLQTVASIGQYVLPGALVVGALLSLMRRRKRAQLYQRVAVQPGKAALEGISWREFEQLVGEWFRRQGYAVKETGGVGVGDGGVDLVLSRDGETYLVQCKQWKAFKVGVKVVRELLGVMAARGAAGAFVITSGDFTAEARRFAADANISLIDGQRLASLLQSASSAKFSPPPSAQKPRLEPSLGAAVEEASAPGVPVCPRCGAVMVRRQASRGARAGQPFWGCSQFPACRGIRPI